MEVTDGGVLRESHVTGMDWEKQGVVVHQKKVERKTTADQQLASREWQSWYLGEGGNQRVWLESSATAPSYRSQG
jgi:hypothetical protein